MPKTIIEIDLPSGLDTSVEVIAAIEQIMNKFNGKLSSNGRDRKAIYAWFVERYNPGAGFQLSVNPNTTLSNWGCPPKEGRCTR